MKSFFKNKYITIVLLATIGVLGVAVQLKNIKKAENDMHAGHHHSQSQNAAAGGMGQSSPLIGGAFTLVDQNGAAFTEADLQGKYSLIYFGFTYCPDICPMGLGAMASAYEDLPKEAQDNLNLVFITVDPERDTPELLSDYVPTFHPAFIGLTGTQEQVKDVSKTYKVYYAKDEREDLDALGHYLMNHSSYIYLMDKDGVTNLGFFKHESTPETIREGVLQTMKAAQ